MAIEGIFYGATANAWIKPMIRWTAVADTEGNYSDVTATLSYIRTNAGYTTSGHWAGNLTVNGDTKAASGVYVQITEHGYTETLTHRVRVYHEEDGTKTVSISATGGIGGTTLSYTAIAGEVQLEQIPRAASIAATDADIGAVSMVTVGKRSDRYTHTVAYRFGKLEGYLSENGLSDSPVKLTCTGIPFRLPESFYYEIPDAPTGVCTLTCTTYRGDAQVGTPQTTAFTVRADPLQCAPLLSVTAEDVEPVTLALTQDPDIFVRYASRVRCEMTCQGRFGAAVTEKKIAGLTAEEDSLLIEAIDTDTLRFSAGDSRGYETAQSLQKTLVPYFFPTGTMTARRTDATSGNADIGAQGSWYSGSFGASGNTLQARCRINADPWQTLQVQTEGDSYTLAARLSGLTYADAHTVTVEITDAIGTLTLSAHVNPGIPVFDWGKEDFCFRIPVTAPRLSGLADPEAAADAASKGYVDTGIQAAKAAADTKVSATLLWENASLTSWFYSQQLPFDLSGYDAVDIEWSAGEHLPTLRHWSRIRVGCSHEVNIAYNTISGEHPTYSLVRIATVSAAGVHFSQGSMHYWNNGSNYDHDGRAIPARIYGVKGVA